MAGLNSLFERLEELQDELERDDDVDQTTLNMIGQSIQLDISSLIEQNNPYQQSSGSHNYVNDILKVLRAAAKLAAKIPVCGSVLSQVSLVVIDVIEYIFAENIPDIRSVISEELKEIFHKEKLVKANAKVLTLCHMFHLIISYRNRQINRRNIIEGIILNNVWDVIKFLTYIESKIMSDRKDVATIAVSDAKHLILLIEVYCSLSAVLLLNLAVIQIIFPGYADDISEIYTQRIHLFENSISFLAEDNALVSFFFPSRHHAIMASLSYFKKSFQNLDELTTGCFEIKNHISGFKLLPHERVPQRLRSAQYIWPDCYIICRYDFVRVNDNDNICQLYVTTYSYDMRLLLFDFIEQRYKCIFKDDTIHVRESGNKDTCRITRVMVDSVENPGTRTRVYMISNLETGKPYRMKNLTGNIIKPFQQDSSLNEKEYFVFERFEGNLEPMNQLKFQTASFKLERLPPPEGTINKLKALGKELVGPLVMLQ